MANSPTGRRFIIHSTAGEAGDLESTTIFLNEAILPLYVESDGSLPAALSSPSGRYISPSGGALVVPPHSYGFVVLPDAGVAACAAGGGGGVSGVSAGGSGGGSSAGGAASSVQNRQASRLQGKTSAGHVAGSTGRKRGPVFAAAMFFGAVGASGLVCWGWQESRNANGWLRHRRGVLHRGGGPENLPLLVKSRV